MFPLYLFYTDIVSQTLCETLIEDEGIFISNAIKIKEIDNNYRFNRSATSSRNILKHCIGFSCFERCPMIFNERNIINGFNIFLNSYILGESDTEMIARDMYFIYEFNNLPHYIKQIVENKNNNELPNWFENEYKNEIKNLKGFILCDI